jgi:hypothetical protein
VLKMAAFFVQDSSLEESLKSMSVSEERVPERRLTRKDMVLVQNALAGLATEEVLVSAHLLQSACFCIRASTSSIFIVTWGTSC